MCTCGLVGLWAWPHVGLCTWGHAAGQAMIEGGVLVAIVLICYGAWFNFVYKPWWNGLSQEERDRIDLH
jgi:hypothetical protein